MDAELKPQAGGTSRFGDLHTKTYDIELLISGALVFGLFTVPGRMDALFDRWGARLDGIASPALTYFYVYGQMIVYSMLFTFIAHLGLRGYWIALLGLESVWSDGWSWDRLKLGRFTREGLQQRVSTLSDAINAADDRASVIFAAGALLVMVSGYSFFVVVGSVMLAMLIEAATGASATRAFFWTVFGTFGVTIVTLQLDKRLGHRIDPTTRAGRIFRRMVGVGMLFSPLRWTGPIQFVFQSRIGERKVSVAMTTAGTILGVVLVMGMVFRAGALRLDGWTYFDPAPTGGSADPRHYRDGGVEHTGRRPTIDSDVISGPVMRLYLPYRPRRHNPLMARRCPLLAAAIANNGSPDNAAGAACLGALYKVTLDTEVLAPHYTFTREPDSDFVGVLAYLPTSGLQPGPHTLTIDVPGNREDAPPEIVKIPFYSVR